MKIAFIGTGKIINDALYAMDPVTSIEKTAIWARPHSEDKARTIADRHGIPEVYIDYEELLAKTAADTVYIGLVNNVHYEYAKKALLAGKNVILEKPFTGRYAEAEDLKKTAVEQEVILLEAITVLHNGIFTKMQENLPKIGKVRMFLANYSQYSSRYDEYLRGEISYPFDPAYYGGALYDINVYNIHYCVGLFGEPTSATYYPNIGYNGVDISGSMVLTYDGFTAICTGTKDSDSPCFVTIQGEKGYMTLQGKPNTADELMTSYVVDAGFDQQALSDGYGGGAFGTANNPARDKSGAIIRQTTQENYKAGPYHHRMTQEFVDFAKIIDGKDYETAYALLEESLSVMKVIEQALYKSMDKV